MGPTAHPLPQSPTSCLPALRAPDAITEAEVCAGLQNLEALYCPIALSRALQQSSSAAPKAQKRLDLAVAVADSGYVSETEDDAAADEQARQEALAVLRADGFERAFATRWLTGFLGRAEEMTLLSEAARQEASDRVGGLLEALAGPPPDASPLPADDEGITRDFAFVLHPPAADAGPVPLAVQVNDGPLPEADHTAVGLQSFGASVFLSDLLCATPARFGLDALSATSRVVELGAGTGLVSLVLGKVFAALGLRPRLIATDFHPAVLENLRANVAHNFPEYDADADEKEGAPSRSRFPPVETCHLDWAAPSRAPPLEAPADLLVATDVIYAPEHALWLRDCATTLLGPDGAFWVLIAVRVNGKFEGISDTVESAFNAPDAPRGPDDRRLAVLQRDDLAKPPGLGRGDESGYRLFRIGWVDDAEMRQRGL